MSGHSSFTPSFSRSIFPSDLTLETTCLPAELVTRLIHAFTTDPAELDKLTHRERDAAKDLLALALQDFIETFFSPDHPSSQTALESIRFKKYSWLLFLMADHVTDSGETIKLHGLRKIITNPLVKSLLFSSELIQQTFLDVLKTLPSAENPMLVRLMDALLNDIGSRDSTFDFIKSVPGGCELLAACFSDSLINLKLIEKFVRNEEKCWRLAILLTQKFLELPGFERAFITSITTVKQAGENIVLLNAMLSSWKGASMTRIDKDSRATSTILNPLLKHVSSSEPADFFSTQLQELQRALENPTYPENEDILNYHLNALFVDERDLEKQAWFKFLTETKSLEGGEAPILLYGLQLVLQSEKLSHTLMSDPQDFDKFLSNLFRLSESEEPLISNLFLVSPSTPTQTYVERFIRGIFFNLPSNIEDNVAYRANYKRMLSLSFNVLEVSQKLFEVLALEVRPLGNPSLAKTMAIKLSQILMSTFTKAERAEKLDQFIPMQQAGDDLIQYLYRLNREINFDFSLSSDPQIHALRALCDEIGEAEERFRKPHSPEKCVQLIKDFVRSGENIGELRRILMQLEKLSALSIEELISENHFSPFLDSSVLDGSRMSIPGLARFLPTLLNTVNPLLDEYYSQVLKVLFSNFAKSDPATHIKLFTLLVSEYKHPERTHSFSLIPTLDALGVMRLSALLHEFFKTPRVIHNLTQYATENPDFRSLYQDFSRRITLPKSQLLKKGASGSTAFAYLLSPVFRGASISEEQVPSYVKLMKVLLMSSSGHSHFTTEKADQFTQEIKSTIKIFEVEWREAFNWMTSPPLPKWGGPGNDPKTQLEGRLVRFKTETASPSLVRLSDSSSVAIEKASKEMLGLKDNEGKSSLFLALQSGDRLTIDRLVSSEVSIEGTFEFLLELSRSKQKELLTKRNSLGLPLPHQLLSMGPVSYFFWFELSKRLDSAFFLQIINHVKDGKGRTCRDLLSEKGLLSWLPALPDVTTESVSVGVSVSASASSFPKTLAEGVKAKELEKDPFEEERIRREKTLASEKAQLENFWQKLKSQKEFWVANKTSPQPVLNTVIADLESLKSLLSREVGKQFNWDAHLSFEDEAAKAKFLVAFEVFAGRIMNVIELHGANEGGLNSAQAKKSTGRRAPKAAVKPLSKEELRKQREALAQEKIRILNELFSKESVDFVNPIRTKVEGDNTSPPVKSSGAKVSSISSVSLAAKSMTPSSITVSASASGSLVSSSSDTSFSDDESGEDLLGSVVTASGLSSYAASEADHNSESLGDMVLAPKSSLAFSLYSGMTMRVAGVGAEVGEASSAISPPSSFRKNAEFRHGLGFALVHLGLLLAKGFEVSYETYAIAWNRGVDIFKHSSRTSDLEVLRESLVEFYANRYNHSLFAARWLDGGQKKARNILAHSVLLPERAAISTIQRMSRDEISATGLTDEVSEYLGYLGIESSLKQGQFFGGESGSKGVIKNLQDAFSDRISWLSAFNFFSIGTDQEAVNQQNALALLISEMAEIGEQLVILSTDEVLLKRTPSLGEALRLRNRMWHFAEACSVESRSGEELFSPKLLKRLSDGLQREYSTIFAKDLAPAS
jgi:hypothetical protein